MEFAEEGGEGPTPYEVLLQAAMDGDSALFTRQDSVEETWRIMMPLLEHPPPRTATRRAHGDRRRPMTVAAGSAVGTDLGGVMSSTKAKKNAQHDGNAAEVARRRRVASCRRAPRRRRLHADRRLRIPVGLPHRRVVAPDGTIDWLCSRGSTPPACSDHCWTAVRVRSASARSGSTFRAGATTSPVRTRS